MPGTVSVSHFLLMSSQNTPKQSIKTRRMEQMKTTMNRNKKANQVKKMFPKVNRNTEIVLDRDTKQQMIILQREPNSQPNRRNPAPKQAPRMMFHFSFMMQANSPIQSMAFQWDGQVNISLFVFELVLFIPLCSISPRSSFIIHISAKEF